MGRRREPGWGAPRPSGLSDKTPPRRRGAPGGNAALQLRSVVWRLADAAPACDAHGVRAGASCDRGREGRGVGALSSSKQAFQKSGPPTLAHLGRSPSKVPCRTHTRRQTPRLTPDPRPQHPVRPQVTPSCATRTARAPRKLPRARPAPPDWRGCQACCTAVPVAVAAVADHVTAVAVASRHPSLFLAW